MAFESKNASEFLPHRAPFIFIDSLLFADEDNSHCNFIIPETNYFVKNGYFSTPGMIECIAQTAAAGTGYYFKQQNKPVPVGYIGSVQHMEVFDWPPAKAEIIMEVKRIANVLQVSLVSGIVKYQDTVMAKCEMKIFINQTTI